VHAGTLQYAELVDVLENHNGNNRRLLIDGKKVDKGTSLLMDTLHRLLTEICRHTDPSQFHTNLAAVYTWYNDHIVSSYVHQFADPDSHTLESPHALQKEHSDITKFQSQFDPMNVIDNIKPIAVEKTKPYTLKHKKSSLHERDQEKG